MRVQFHPAADAELIEAAQWYEDRHRGFGVRFISAAGDASMAIGKTPLRFSTPPAVRTARDVRRKLLEGFPYSMIYEVREQEILILAVSHTSRRPGYWQARTREKGITPPPATPLR